MRILMLSRDSASVGPVSQTADRWRLLRDRGIELDIILASTRENGGWEEPGMRVYTSGGSFALMRFWNMYQRGRMLVKNVDFITSEDPLELGFVAWLLSRVGKKSFEMQDHAGNFEDVDTLEPFWHVRRWLSRWLLPKSRVIRTVNPQSFERLQHVYRHPAYWLPIAPDQRFLEVARGTAEDIIVCVARLVPVKQIHLLLQAFKLFQKEHAEAQLQIVGDGPLKSDLEQEAQRLEIGNAVHFTGAIDPVSALQKARVFALLSAHEGWGVAAIEAAAIGIPVVMKPTGCGPWLAERGSAILVTDLAPERVAENLEEAWNKIVQPLRAIKTRTQTADEQVAAWKKYGTSL